MTPDYVRLTHEEKLNALRQIEAALNRTKSPTLRACGLTEDIALKVASEQLVELFECGEDYDDFLDGHRVDKMSANGLGILAQGDVAEPSPLKISVVRQQEPVLAKMRRWLLSELWDVFKISLGIPVGILVGWFLWKHHWQ